MSVCPFVSLRLPGRRVCLSVCLVTSACLLEFVVCLSFCLSVSLVGCFAVVVRPFVSLRLAGYLAVVVRQPICLTAIGWLFGCLDCLSIRLYRCVCQLVWMTRLSVPVCHTGCNSLCICVSVYLCILLNITYFCYLARLCCHFFCSSIVDNCKMISVFKKTDYRSRNFLLIFYIGSCMIWGSIN